MICWFERRPCIQTQRRDSKRALLDPCQAQCPPLAGIEDGLMSTHGCGGPSSWEERTRTSKRDAPLLIGLLVERFRAPSSGDADPGQDGADRGADVRIVLADGFDREAMKAIALDAFR